MDCSKKAIRPYASSKLGVLNRRRSTRSTKTDLANGKGEGKYKGKKQVSPRWTKPAVKSRHKEEAIS